MSVKLTFLGGLGEIGRNCASIEIDGSVAMIDCGLMFPEEDMLGVDLVLPDFSSIIDRKDDFEHLWYLHLSRQGGVGYQVPVLTVDRDHRVRPHHVVERLEFLRSSMARNVHVRVPPVIHGHTETVQVVDHLRNGLLVAWNRCRRDDDRVRFIEGDRAMLACGHPGQGCEWLSLAPRRDDPCVYIWHLHQFRQFNERILREVQRSKIHGDIRVPEHRPADERELSSIVHHGVDRLLHPVHV